MCSDHIIHVNISSYSPHMSDLRKQRHHVCYICHFATVCAIGSSDGWAKNQLGERRLGELFFGRQTIGRQARTVRRQQIGRLADIVQTVGRNV